MGWSKGRTGHKRPFLPWKRLCKQLGKLKRKDIINSKMFKAHTCVFKKKCSKDRNEPWGINVRADITSSLSRGLFLLLGYLKVVPETPKTKMTEGSIYTQVMLPNAKWGRMVPMSQGVLAPGKNGDNHLFKPVDVRKANSFLWVGSQLLKFNHR